MNYAIFPILESGQCAIRYTFSKWLYKQTWPKTYKSLSLCMGYFSAGTLKFIPEKWAVGIEKGKEIVCPVPTLCQALSIKSKSCGEGMWAPVGLCWRNVCIYRAASSQGLHLCTYGFRLISLKIVSYFFSYRVIVVTYFISEAFEISILCYHGWDSTVHVLTSVWHSKTAYSELSVISLCDETEGRRHEHLLEGLTWGEQHKHMRIISSSLSDFLYDLLTYTVCWPYYIWVTNLPYSVLNIYVLSPQSRISMEPLFPRTLIFYVDSIGESSKWNLAALHTSIF